MCEVVLKQASVGFMLRELPPKKWTTS
jgi:hypothetical protein